MQKVEEAERHSGATLTLVQDGEDLAGVHGFGRGGGRPDHPGAVHGHGCGDLAAHTRPEEHGANLGVGDCDVAVGVSDQVADLQTGAEAEGEPWRQKRLQAIGGWWWAPDGDGVELGR